jgi:hypothetical protein
MLKFEDSLSPFWSGVSGIKSTALLVSYWPDQIAPDGMDDETTAAGASANAEPVLSVDTLLGPDEAGKGMLVKFRILLMHC